MEVKMENICKDIVPTLVENTVMQLRIKDNVPLYYRIAPING
jgi:hypothetical protein